MYILRVVIFSSDESNLTRIRSVFKEFLGKSHSKRNTSKSGSLTNPVIVRFSASRLFVPCVRDSRCCLNVREDEKNNLPV